MAQYDDDTRKFMDDVSDDKQRERTKTEIAKRILTVGKAVQKPKSIPRSALKEFAKQLIKNASFTHNGLGMTILNMYRKLNDLYGQSWWDWEPETLWFSLEGENFALTPHLKAAVQALQVILKTDQAHQNWHIFEKVAHALNDNSVDFKVLQPLEPTEASLAYKLICRIRPQCKFDPEVITYIAATLHHAGLTFAPPELFPEGTQEALSKFVYDVGLLQGVARAWPEKMDGDSPEAIQLAKLHEIRDYVEKETTDA